MTKMIWNCYSNILKKRLTQERHLLSHRCSTTAITLLSGWARSELSSGKIEISHMLHGLKNGTNFQTVDGVTLGRQLSASWMHMVLGFEAQMSRTESCGANQPALRTLQIYSSNICKSRLQVCLG